MHVKLMIVYYWKSMGLRMEEVEKPWSTGNEGGKTHGDDPIGDFLEKRETERQVIITKADFVRRFPDGPPHFSPCHAKVSNV